MTGQYFEAHGELVIGRGGAVVGIIAKAADDAMAVKIADTLTREARERQAAGRPDFAWRRYREGKA